MLTLFESPDPGRHFVDAQNDDKMETHWFSWAWSLSIGGVGVLMCVFCVYGIRQLSRKLHWQKKQLWHSGSFHQLEQ